MHWGRKLTLGSVLFTQQLQDFSDQQKVGAIISKRNSEACRASVESLHRTVYKSFRFTALEAVEATFRPVRQIQIALEACNEPVIHMVLPMLFKTKMRLRNIASGFVSDPN